MTFTSVVSGLSPTWWLRLDDTSGTTAVDAQSVINGTYVNAPTLNQTGYAHDGAAVTFASASSQYVSVADNAIWDVGTSDFSIGFALKMSAWNTSSNQALFARGNGAGVGDYFIITSQYLTNRFSARLTGTWYDFDPGVTIADGAFHLVGFSFDRSGNATMTLDGTTVATADISAQSATNLTGIRPVGVGGVYDPTPSLFTNGTMAEIMFWNGAALSEANWASIHAASVQEATTDVDAEHAAYTVAGYQPTVDIETSAEVSSITLTAYTPTIQTTTTTTTTVTAGHATIDMWASEGEYSELEADIEHASITVAGYASSTSVSASAGDTTITLSAEDANSTEDGSAQAGHASISIASNAPSHGAPAGHASLTTSITSSFIGGSPVAGLASSQFKMSAFDAGVSAEIISNATSESIPVTVSAYQPTITVDISAEHAAITVTGLSADILEYDADIVIETFSVTTIKVEDSSATTIVVSTS